ncbi:hypothetical protein Pla52n_40340 [Stieleria varia]|uniref:Uncharacterized protein n=1 Tax=Stieleria varia TaxID=2528005 RepID=A0A5C6AV38_9BACT|nr:hypothetical protein Pla52n_40340 [Stieleria varia]
MSNRNSESSRGCLWGVGRTRTVEFSSPDSLGESWNLGFGRRGGERPRKRGRKRETPAGHAGPTGVNWFARVFAFFNSAPRVGLYSNHGLVELGSYEINKLRRPFRVPFYEWTPVSAIPLPQNKLKGPRYDRLKLAREYQSILDSGVFETRTELARYLGVSRARVTQVLRRLSEHQ